MEFRETPSFLSGRAAEDLISAEACKRGFLVLDTRDFSGPNGEQAPSLHGQAHKLIMPDLALAKPGVTLKWAEVKAKTEPTYTILTGRYEHGIGLRKWAHYCEMQRTTGCSVWFFIFEINNQVLLVESLDQLRPVARPYRGNAMDWGGMIFWPRDSFTWRFKVNALPGLFDPLEPFPFDLKKGA